MFRLKYIISTTLVLILLSITSIIKNQTKIFPQIPLMIYLFF